MLKHYDELADLWGSVFHILNFKVLKVLALAR